MQNIDELRDIIHRKETAIDSREETITKMHALLDKKEKEKRRMQEEIDDLRRQVHAAFPDWLDQLSQQCRWQ